MNAAQAVAGQQRKALQAQSERAGVERDRASRERDALKLKCGSLKQQCQLLETVAKRATRGGATAVRGGRGGAAAVGCGSGWGLGEMVACSELFV